MLRFTGFKSSGISQKSLVCTIGMYRPKMWSVTTKLFRY